MHVLLSTFLHGERSSDACFTGLENSWCRDIGGSDACVSFGGKCMVLEGDRSTKKRHKEWRKIAKKERRRHLRRRAAAEREADEQRLRAALEESAGYSNWLEQREAKESEKAAREKEEHDERERLWLEEEVSDKYFILRILSSKF